MTDPRVDRRPSFDERSRRFAVRPLLDALPDEKRLRGRGWTPGPTLDQSNDGHCVGFGITHRRNGRPISADLGDAAAHAAFYVAQKHDRAMGNVWTDGASVLAGMKAGKELGWWESYHWIGAGSQTPIEDFIDATVDIGPVVLGLAWLESMFHPRPSGLLEVHGSEQGGHCLCAPSVRLKARLRGEGSKPMELAVLQQSWGLSHGVGAFGQTGGFVYMRLEDLESLLHRQGEGAVPVEKRLVQ